ncbi:isoflavone reductase family protein [Stagonosporopsis vannaccii]|nr:isoflavone reductase family protein [Stagonosporopsis vannaccii]
MSHQINKVALAGPTGNLGSALLNALTKSLKFSVTVVVRSKGKTFPPGVSVKVADFNSVESIAAAFQGQDAVIDATSGPDPTVNLRIADGAAAAGVYRLIPAEFSADPHNSKVRALLPFQGKAQLYAHVQKLSSNGSITYTTISNGGFLDWALRVGFLNIDLAAKKVVWMNDGELVVPWTLLDSVGTAVVNALVKAKETENRSLYIHSLFKSQKDIGNLAAEALGSEGWEYEQLDFEEVYKHAMTELQAGKFSTKIFVDLIQYASATPGYFGTWAQDDNELLGVQELDDEEVRQLIRRVAADNTQT